MIVRFVESHRKVGFHQVYAQYHPYIWIASIVGSRCIALELEETSMKFYCPNKQIKCVRKSFNSGSRSYLNSGGDT
jgi:hypothetical protein